MERKYEFSIGEYYHAYNRGVEKRKVFLNTEDLKRFHRLLFLSNNGNSFKFRDLENQPLNTIDRGNPIIAIGAYVLMPNHFHILAKEICQNGLSMFMQKLTTGYSMYFNKKYERVGPLFQGKFKAEPIQRDEHLKYLYAYIHLNPVKLIESTWKETGIKNMSQALKHIEQYCYSSYEDYCGNIRNENLILAKDEFPNYFSKKHSFKTYINEWLSFNSESSPIPTPVNSGKE